MVLSNAAGTAAISAFAEVLLSAASVTVVARQRPGKGYVADDRSRCLCGSAIAVAPSNGSVNKAHSGHLISDGKTTETLYLLGQVPCPESSAQLDLGITV